jgi:hypothetical protein
MHMFSLPVISNMLCCSINYGLCLFCLCLCCYFRFCCYIVIFLWFGVWTSQECVFLLDHNTLFVSDAFRRQLGGPELSFRVLAVLILKSKDIITIIGY